MILLLAFSYINFRCPDVIYWHLGNEKIPYYRNDLYEGACSWQSKIDDTPSMDLVPFKKIPLAKPKAEEPWYKFW